MQNIIGIVLIATGVIVVKAVAEHKPVTPPLTQAVANSQPTDEPARQQTEVRSDGQRKIYIPAALLQPNSEPLAIVAGASREYGVPPEVLLSHWYLESGMQLSGDRGGAGGYFALAQIVEKQTAISERHRSHRFVANERDLRAIAEHCGYDLQELRGSSTGALGPMQFQPSTWVLGAVDADGDGKACPLNLADAMYTAARKLSRDHSRLGDWDTSMIEYAGGNFARNRAYVRRAQPLLRFFRKFWEERMPTIASN